ncbi:hypothetical protein AV521_46025 [Streptomyces sp. IMTB 2501]|uniref:hypothetical protein n=1 Tax=Streptomyces sp. IMTB 2501 TaxID=1776340 RepID=UPI00096E28F7|nr:hypothetical protein [Streptomyces sp. IMTB 2501]OLZ59135.1 hypothetical protein AV521_46025 [Streptomyces sp. IMTB 2501]
MVVTLRPLSPEVLSVLDARSSVGWETRASEHPLTADDDPKSHAGTVIGVLGGHEGGGDQDED